jgi:hypothetical protein
MGLGLFSSTADVDLRIRYTNQTPEAELTKNRSDCFVGLAIQFSHPIRHVSLQIPIRPFWLNVE